MNRLGFVSIAAAVPGSGPLAPVVGTVLGVVEVLRWMLKNRHTDDLVPGVSFPGHDDYGNPVEAPDPDELYRYADIVSQTGADHSIMQSLIDKGAPMIAAKDANGTNIIFATAKELIDALTNERAWPYHTDGTPYDVVWNGTDFIMDGQPVQSYFTGGAAGSVIDMAQEIPWYVWVGVAYLGYRLVRG